VFASQTRISVDVAILSNAEQTVWQPAAMWSPATSSPTARYRTVFRVTGIGVIRWRP